MLQRMIEYVDRLKEVDTEGVEPISVTLGDEDYVRGSSDHLPLYADFTLI